MKLFILKTVFYLALVFALNIGFGLILKNYEFNDLKEAGIQFSALSWDEYYQNPDQADILILGSSHAFRGYDPMTISNHLTPRYPVFNLGTAAQSPQTSYYILKEVINRQPPRMVIMDIYFMVFTSDEQINNGRTAYMPMQPGPGKRLFHREGFSFKDRMLLTYVPSYIYRKRLKSVIRKYSGNPQFPTTEGSYRGQGFATRVDSISMHELSSDNTFDYFEIDTTDITMKSALYLRKLLKLCEQNNIEVLLMSAPMPKITIDKIETYNNIHQYFMKVAKQNAVTYLDYNQPQNIHLTDTIHFYNDDHLNREGARIFSIQVAKDLMNYLPLR